jgi:hypothetical protein
MVRLCSLPAAANFTAAASLMDASAATAALLGVAEANYEASSLRPPEALRMLPEPVRPLAKAVT